MHPSMRCVVAGGTHFLFAAICDSRAGKHGDHVLNFHRFRVVPSSLDSIENSISFLPVSKYCTARQLDTENYSGSKPFSRLGLFALWRRKSAKRLCKCDYGFWFRATDLPPATIPKTHRLPSENPAKLMIKLS